MQYNEKFSSTQKLTANRGRVNHLQFIAVQISTFPLHVMISDCTLALQIMRDHRLHNNHHDPYAMNPMGDNMLCHVILREPCTCGMLLHFVSH